MSKSTSFTGEEWAVFHDDAERMLSGVEEALLNLENDPTNDNELNGLCRDLHTLKGSAGFLGLVAISTVAHAAEDMVDAARRQGKPLDAEMVDALLGTLDAIRTILSESEQGPREEHDQLIAPIVDRLLRCNAAPAPTRTVTGRAMTVDAALALTHKIGEALKTSGSARQMPTLEHDLDRLDHTAKGMGALTYVDALQAFRDSLPGDRAPVLTLLWALATRQLEASAETGLVLFDEDPAPPGRQDPVLVAQFLQAAGALLEPMYAWVDAASGGRSSAEPSPVLDARAMCAGMKLTELLDAVDPIDAVVSGSATGSGDGAAQIQAFSSMLIELQDDWQKTTEQAPSAQHDLRNIVTRIVDARAKGTPVAAPKKKAPKPPPKPTKAAPSKFLRLEVEKVANLMSLAGEIGLAVGSVFSLPVFQEIDDEDVRIAIDRVEGLIRELQDTSATLGLVPLASVFGRMKRLARDLGRQTGKEFVLTTDGEDTEIDKLLVDALNDPLVHMIRNAAGHGLESPEGRAEAGKGAVGQIRLSASRQGNSVIVTVRDDGKGMDRNAILKRAIVHGLVDESQAASMTDSQVWSLIFEPGLSTAAKVNEVQGRGVGMDVVKTSIQSLGGKVSVLSRPGVGTAIRLHLPLTLAFLDSMVVQVGTCTFAIPVSSVSRVFRVEQGGVVKVETEGVDLIRVGQHLIPALSLESFFSEEEVEPSYVGRLAVVVRTGGGRLAIPIDELLGHEQVTMQPLTGYLRGIRASAGCGLLRNGGVAIALNCEQLHEIRQSEAA